VRRISGIQIKSASPDPDSLRLASPPSKRKDQSTSPSPSSARDKSVVDVASLQRYVAGDRNRTEFASQSSCAVPLCPSKWRNLGNRGNRGNRGNCCMSPRGGAIAAIAATASSKGLPQSQQIRKVHSAAAPSNAAGQASPCTSNAMTFSTPPYSMTAPFVGSALFIAPSSLCGASPHGPNDDTFPVLGARANVPTVTLAQPYVRMAPWQFPRSEAVVLRING